MTRASTTSSRSLMWTLVKFAGSMQTSSVTSSVGSVNTTSPKLQKRVSVRNEKGVPLFSLHGSARQRNRSGSTTQKGKIRIQPISFVITTMHLLRSAAPERAYSHRGWEVHPAHDFWNMPGFRWMVFEPGSDTRCSYVGSLDEARVLINQELSPSAST